MNRKKVAKIVFGISAAILFISSIWFFILFGIANPYAYQKLNMLEHPQNKTKEVIVNYNFEIKRPAVTVQKINNQTAQATIDVGGIMTGIISGGILMILSKLLNRFWPDKK